MNFKRNNILFKLIVAIFLLSIFVYYKNSKVTVVKLGTNANKKIEMKKKNSVPVLMYHSISKDKNGLFVVDKEKFREQMKYIKDSGYRTLSLEEVYYYLSQNRGLPEKSVVITFDDGYKDNYDNAYPILKEFNLKATIFVVTDYIKDSSYFLNLNELKEMYDNGIDIQCHTTKHQKMDKLSYEKQLDVLKNSKSYLEKLLNKEVKYIAYPFGRYNKNTIKAAEKAGYLMGFTTHLGYLTEDEDFYKINRTCIPGFLKLDMFKIIMN